MNHPDRNGALLLRALRPLGFLAILLSSPSARADLLFSLTPEATTDSSGLFSYSYELMVHPTSELGVSMFVLGASPNADPTEISGPDEWDAFFSDIDGLFFFSSPDTSFDIMPGMSGTFSFLSTLGPGNAPFTAFGFDDLAGTFGEESGVTFSAVPEPGSWILMGVGLAGFGIFRGRRAFEQKRSSGKRNWKNSLVRLGAVIFLGTIRISGAEASDHGDTRENVARISTDMTDVFIFPSPENSDNVVLATTVRPLITPEIVDTIFFDPGILIQFKIDTNGDFIEDQVIQARFSGFGPNQRVFISGPSKPFITGNRSIFGRRHPVVGKVNETFEPRPGMEMKVFAGVREDPFFFDVGRLIEIFPDRGIALLGQPDLPNPMFPFGPNVPQFLSWNPPGVAADFFENLSVLAVVVELPRTALGGELIRLWCTVSVPEGPPGFRYRQQERLARPIVNEALATVSNNRHSINNMINPTEDAMELENDIESFLTFPAGRSPEIRSVIRSVLIPDVMVADLSSDDDASYLGVETGGATGGTFGGRDLRDDVVDISLGIVFGTTVSDLGLAADDGAAIPALATDNVGDETKDFIETFPYLGDPD